MTALKRILVVDDEPNVRLMFRVALETAGFAVAEASDGESALELIDSGQGSFDLVTLDLNMPGLGGMETLGRLGASGFRTPVVVVTAHGDVAKAVEAMRLGAIDFLLKPITPAALRKTVSEFIGRHAARPITLDDPESAEPITVRAVYQRNLARARRALDNHWFDEAEIFLKQSLALMPDSPEANNLRGVLHELRGNHDAAYDCYRAALRADKDYEPARQNMLRYYERFTFGRSDTPLDVGGR